MKSSEKLKPNQFEQISFSDGLLKDSLPQPMLSMSKENNEFYKLKEKYEGLMNQVEIDEDDDK